MAIRDNPVVALTQKTWEFSKGNRKAVALYFFLFLCANIISFFDPLIIGKVLNLIQEGGINPANLPEILMWLVLFFALWFFFWIFHGPARVLEMKNAFLVKANYKMFLMRGTMDLPAEWHTDHHSGDTIDKVEKGTQALYSYAGDTFQVIETILRFFMSYFALVYFNLHAGYIVFFLVIATLWIIFSFDKRLIPLYKQINRDENVVTAKVFDALSNITTVIILRIEKLVASAIYKKIMKPFKVYMRNRKINEVKWFTVSMMTSLMTFFVLLSFVLNAIRTQDVVMVGTVFVLYQYIGRINNLFFRFAWKYNEIVKQHTNILNAEEVSDEFSKKKKEKSIYLGKWKELSIHDLSFSYHTEKGSNLHLDKVTMSVQRGQRVALVGASGSGKTTLLKVMRELYNPKKVTLFLDGVNLKNGFTDISDHITLIPQDPEIFNATIKDNITMGISRPLAILRKYARMARFSDVVKRLPKKWESSIVEKGVNLSGGEKQRLALARGLLACEDKEFVLLDEPTSSVDPQNEILIYNSIFKTFKKKTIISSIHRMHLLPLFDYIYLFKNGKIVGQGTFDELLSISKDFQKSWEKYSKAHR